MPVLNEPMPRRTMVLFFLVDASSSMEGGKIGAVNDAIRNVLPMVNDISVNNNDAEIRVAVLKFSSGVEWVYSEPKLASDFEWLDIQAAGLTDMGEACRELSSKLSRTAFMKSEGGFFAPAVILLSDGHPTDDFAAGLNSLKRNKWFMKGIRVAIAIGNDADKDALAQFCLDKEGVFDVHDIESLRRVIRLVAVTSSQIGSQSTTAADTTKQTTVIDKIKIGIGENKAEQGEDGTQNPAEPPKDNWNDWD